MQGLDAWLGPRRGSHPMRVAILLLAAASAWAADVPRLSFSKSFPGSTPPFFSITVERSGSAFYNESEDPDNAEKLQLEPPVLDEMFGLVEKLDRFKKPLESGLKVANMGQKTLSPDSSGFLKR